MRTSRLCRLAGVALAFVALSACGSDSAGVVHLYDPAPVPAVPDRTADITSPLHDGQFWSPSVAVKDGQLVFALGQAFFGPTCTTELGAAACTGDMGVADTLPATVTLDPTGLASVSVVDTQHRNYAVTGAELAGLVGGAAPSSPAPATYAYHPYPFLLTVLAGAVVEAHQIWVEGSS